MTEQIGKVTLDYTFYNGQDQYSDGDIENDLLQLIMEEPDVEKILAEKMTGGKCYIIFHLSDKIYWSGILLKKMHLYLKLGQDVELSVEYFAEMQSM